MKITKILAGSWIGVTIASSLELIYQYLFTESVNYIEIAALWGASTVVVVFTGVLFLEYQEKQNRKSKISELENRIDKLEGDSE